MNIPWKRMLRVFVLLMLLMVFMLIPLPNNRKEKVLSHEAPSTPSNQSPTIVSSDDLIEQDGYISPPVYGYDENLAKGLYPFVLHTRMGDLAYFNQEDARWADSLYGSDPIITHGCGPTLLAILVASYVDHGQNPVTMAQWAYEHGYYSRKDGSYHSIVSDGLRDFGFEVKSFPGRSPESIYGALDSGHFLIALMGKGNFTANGHFILLTEVTDDGHIHIADPKSFIHTQQIWDANLLLQQLKDEAGAGGPLWAVKPPGR